jgi:hypothetical protein
MRVTFSYHAIDRMRTRMNVRIRTTDSLDISDSFVEVRKYFHTKYKCEVSNFVSKDVSLKTVLVVNKQKREVLTAMNDGVVVDDALRQLSKVR